MFESAPSPGRTAQHSTPYAFATPVRTASTLSHPYSHALTSTDASAKAVRFQNQPLPPQPLQYPQNPSLSSIATPNKSAVTNTASTSTQPQPPQPQPQPQQMNTAVSTNAAAAASASSANKMLGGRPAVVSRAGGESAAVLQRRIKWNLSALGLLWIVPTLSTRPRDVYWAILDQIYVYVGGDIDEVIDGVVGWILWAISVVLLFNVVEAGILVQRASWARPPTETIEVALASTTSSASKEQSKNQSLVHGLDSASVARSINFVAASRLKGSPKTRTSNIGAGSPISRCSPKPSPKRDWCDSPGSSSVDYSQFSPAHRRTSSALSSHSYNSGFAQSNNRIGSPGTPGTPGTPISEFNPAIGAVAPASSPLAAFRARHISRGASGSQSQSPSRARSITPAMSAAGIDETSFDASAQLDQAQDEATFLGDESFEVDRALKSLRGSFGGVSSTPAATLR